MSDKTYARADIPVLVNNVGIVIPNTGYAFGYSGNIVPMTSAGQYIRVFAAPETKAALAERMLERALDTEDHIDRNYRHAITLPFGATGEYMRSAGKASLPLVITSPTGIRDSDLSDMTGKMAFNDVDALWLYLQIRLRSRST